MDTDQRINNRIQATAGQPFIIQFFVDLFFVFFLPILIGILFMLLTSPWFIEWFKYQIPNDFKRYVITGIVFIALTYIVIGIYEFAVLNDISNDKKSQS